MEPIEYCPKHEAEFNAPGCSQCWHDARSDRDARLARIDATASDFAIRYAPQVGYDYDWFNPKQSVFKAAYRFALALERARDEAVKELP